MTDEPKPEEKPVAPKGVGVAHEIPTGAPKELPKEPETKPSQK